LKVTLLAYMQVNPDFIYSHDWHSEVESEPEWIASALMRSTKTLRPINVIMDENNEVKCPHCKGEDPEIEECHFCEGIGVVPIVAKRIYDSIILGHSTVAGMTDFIFFIEDVSRSLTHQLVRHRTGWYLQQSSRAVNPLAMATWYVIPPKIAKTPAALAEFMEVIDRCKLGYKRLKKMKIPLEDCRFVLPQGTKQRITMKIDGCNLIHFLKLRLDIHAQWEIRQLAKRLHQAVSRVCPNLFKKEMMEYWW